MAWWDFFSRSVSKNTGYIVDIPLEEDEFKRYVRRGWIDSATLVRHVDSNTWVKAGDVPALREYLGEKSIRELIHELLAELERLFSSSHGTPFKLPEHLAQTLTDELDKGHMDVALTVGRANGRPAFIVLSMPQGGDPQLAAVLEIDTTAWEQTAIDAWPDTGDPKAPMWRVSR